MMIESADGYIDRALRTGDHIETHLCIIDGGDHDFRPYEYTSGGGRWQHTSYRCVWCHGVACGNYGDADPCWLVYHHFSPHRSRSGVVWPLGGDRPDQVLG